jgi:predicted esterase
MDTNTASKTATILLHGEGADDPDQLVPVTAGELFEWAWLAAELADWLDHAAEATRHDFHRFFAGLRGTDKTAYFLAHISERIAAPLAGDRGQP